MFVAVLISSPCGGDGRDIFRWGPGASCQGGGEGPVVATAVGEKSARPSTSFVAGCIPTHTDTYCMMFLCTPLDSSLESLRTLANNTRWYCSSDDDGAAQRRQSENKPPTVVPFRAAHVEGSPPCATTFSDRICCRRAGFLIDHFSPASFTGLIQVTSSSLYYT